MLINALTVDLSIPKIRTPNAYLRGVMLDKTIPAFITME
jgi:hypothetical protein